MLLLLQEYSSRLRNFFLLSEGMLERTQSHTKIKNFGKEEPEKEKTEEQK